MAVLCKSQVPFLARNHDEQVVTDKTTSSLSIVGLYPSEDRICLLREGCAVLEVGGSTTEHALLEVCMQACMILE